MLTDGGFAEGGFADGGFARRGGFDSDSELFLPIDPSLVIADWISDLGVQGNPAVPGNVAAWTDQIGNVQVVQATVGNQPTFVEGVSPSGRPALRFDGATEFLRIAAFDLSSVQDVDWWIVVERTAATGLTQQMFDFDGTVRNVFISDTFDRARHSIFGNVGTNQISDTDTTLLNTMRVHNPRVIISAGPGAESDAFFDAALTQYDTPAGAANNTDANLGSGELTFGQRASSAGNGNNFGGDIVRIAVVQPTADRTAIAQFLSDLYGVP